MRVTLGLALTLVLVGCAAAAFYLLAALVARGIGSRDWVALAAAAAVIGMTSVMARRRRR